MAAWITQDNMHNNSVCNSRLRFLCKIDNILTFKKHSIGMNSGKEYM